MTRKAKTNGNGHQDHDDAPPPHDLGAEQDVIGCALQNPSLVTQAARVLGPEDFWGDPGRMAFKAFQKAVNAAGGARLIGKDLATEAVKTPAVTEKWLDECSERIADPSNIDVYARQVRTMADRRRVMDAADRLVHLAKDGQDITKAIERLQRAAAPPPWMQANKLKVTNMEDIAEKKLDWLWHQRLLRGHLNLLGGAMGSGKSAVMCNLTGRITSGSPWPRINEIDTDESVRNTVGNVAFLCLEAGASDELKPRLRVAGADMKRVKVIEGRIGADGLQVVNLVTDMDAIKREIHDALPGGLTMLVIDPIIDFLPGVKVNDDEELHRALQPLMRFAQECGVCVVMIVHDNKRMDASAQDKTAGARAFVSMSRTSFRIDRDKTDPQVKRITMLPIKCNYMRDEFGMGAVIYPSEEDGEYPTIRWEPEPVRKTADDVLREKFKPKNNKKAEAKEFAEKYLTEHGPTKAIEFFEACDQMGGHKESTVKKGLADTGESRKIGKIWWWKLKTQEWPKEEPNLLNQGEKKEPF